MQSHDKPNPKNSDMELEYETNLSDCYKTTSIDPESGLSYQERNQGPAGFLIKMHSWQILLFALYLKLK